MLDYMRQKIAISITYFRLTVATAFAIMMLSCWPASVLALSEMQAGVIVAIRGEAEIKRKDHLITASSGTAVIAGDTIITGNNSWTQIALRDHALFSLAANSQFTVERFTQDNNPDSDQLVTSLISGVVKFISGKIASQNHQAMQVKFGTVTAAIRGTSGIISNLPANQSQLTLLSGKIELIDNRNRKLSQLVRSGWGVDISSIGAPSALKERSAEQLSVWLAQTASNRPASDTAITDRSDASTDLSETASAEPDAQPLSQLLASGETGNLSPEQQLLFDQLDDAQKYDPANNQITIDTSLIDYALSGGQPLWMRHFGAGYFGNPPRPEDQIDYDIYNNHYRGLVSERYSGSVTFSHDGFALVPVGTINGGGIAGLNASLDYDTVSLSGQFWLKDVYLEGIDFADSLPHQIGFSGLAIDGLVVDIPVGTLQLSSTDPNAAITNATAEMTTSIGSIADGNSVIDGRLGLFAVTLTPDTASSPALSGQAIIAGQ